MDPAIPVRVDLGGAFFAELSKHYSDSATPPMMPLRVVSKICKATRAHDEQQIANTWNVWMATQGANCPCPGYSLSLSEEQQDTALLKVYGALLPDGKPHLDAPAALFVFQAGGRKFDPFEDAKADDTEQMTKTRAEVSGRIQDFAARILSQQHRTNILLFFVNGLQIRAARWTRSDVTFAKAFDYTKNRELLRDLLWSVSRLSSRELGYDQSVSLLSPEDEDYTIMSMLAKEKVSDVSEEEDTIVDRTHQGPYIFKYVRAAFATAIAGDAPRYRITIPTSERDRFFLAGKPTIVAGGTTSRSTRGYVAWDVTGKRFVWLKDVWRRADKYNLPEGLVLRDLNRTGVCNVPTYVCEGELKHDGEGVGLADPSHDEDPNTYHDYKDYCPPPPDDAKRRLRHSRTVVEQVALPLSVFKNGKQLLSVVRDCVQAHSDAVNKTQIIHGDLSSGNVLICPTVVRCEEDGKSRVVWKGLLIDWELSRRLDVAFQVKGITQGTWQFASAWNLDHPSNSLVTADELESFYNIVLYMALRFLRNTCPNVAKAIRDYFEGYERAGSGEYRCGKNKRWSMKYGQPPDVRGQLYHWLDDACRASGHPINRFFGMMLVWFEARYIVLHEPTVHGHYIAMLSRRIRNVDNEVREYARKLEDHGAMLELLNDCLSMKWPMLDKVGDLVENPISIHSIRTTWDDTDH